ncbi:Peptidyl-prolyl cis-trans isomerase D (PPIase D) (40 kDa peptidyl-prolyl cis-trans isomerase) (Cyclophilin-40) (CYP-40) (Rotamase D) [Durusdinium trenchii]|uniref:Peptidyl-prolyl cis-trans isomerase D (PPIase D) (40 kDa peptidyl-prolyl cis-trans isomerase) (Cyclophilin-40) (CYP-40) (Rotamase D) n=1 Tax=Durusdinium trenchii TaxID=1381693 RepID=A0ABP0LNF7_9DINO
MITLNEASHLDGINQIIGRVIQGMEVLRIIEGFPTDRKIMSFAERDVKSHWGGRPMVDVIIERCGEVAEEVSALPGLPPPDGDIFPEHHQDFSSDDSELLLAQERLREMGNAYFKQNRYEQALAKYQKALAYLDPLLKKQSRKEFEEEEPATLLAGGRPKDRTEPVKADCMVKLNVCQVLLAMGEWRSAMAMADVVLQDLIGQNSRKGYGALPKDTLVAKAFYRRAKARIGLSDVTGVSHVEEAIQDLQQALQVDPENIDVKRELDKVRALQRAADAKGRAVYERMMRVKQV